VPPLIVTATCDQVFTGSCTGESMRCSALVPLIVMAKRGPMSFEMRAVRAR
jgi:hypothetical protein